jgi:hypothetical protein
LEQLLLALALALALALVLVLHCFHHLGVLVLLT